MSQAIGLIETRGMVALVEATRRPRDSRRVNCQSERA